MVRALYTTLALAFVLVTTGCSASLGSIVVTPNEVVLLPGSSVSLVATVRGSSPHELIWEATAGAVIARGSEALYRAPSRLGDHTISVRSGVDPSIHAQVTIRVEDHPDFAPSTGTTVVEGDIGDVVRLVPDASGVTRFASRVFNAEYHVEFVDDAGRPLPGVIALFSERADGSALLLAIDPARDSGPLVILGGRDHFSRYLEGKDEVPENAEIGGESLTLTFLIIGGIATFGSILWTGIKTEKSGQEIEVFFATDAVDCAYTQCYCKTPNEISVLHAARAQQQFAIPRVVLSGAIVGLDVADEAVGFVLDVTDLWDNFGLGPVKLNPFSWAEDWVADSQDRNLLTGIQPDSHVLYAVDTVADPGTGRVYELVFILDEDCDPRVGPSYGPPSLTLSGRVEANGQLVFTARLPLSAPNVPVYFVFRSGTSGAVVARHALTDWRGTATVSGPLWMFGSEFGFGTNSVITAAAPTLSLVGEATLEALTGGPPPPSATVRGIWTFAGSGANRIAGGGDWMLRNVTFSNDNLVLDGIYENSGRPDAELAVVPVTNMNIDRFTLAMRFYPIFPNGHWMQPIITAGSCTRWLAVSLLESGETFLLLNNRDVAFPIAPMYANQWNELHLTYDHGLRRFTVTVNESPTQTIHAGSDFDWNIRTSGGGQDLNMQNLGNGAAFRGRVDWIVWTNDISSRSTIQSLLLGR